MNIYYCIDNSKLHIISIALLWIKINIWGGSIPWEDCFEISGCLGNSHKSCGTSSPISTIVFGHDPDCYIALCSTNSPSYQPCKTSDFHSKSRRQSCSFWTKQWTVLSTNRFCPCRRVSPSCLHSRGWPLCSLVAIWDMPLLCQHGFCTFLWV